MVIDISPSVRRIVVKTALNFANELLRAIRTRVGLLSRFILSH
jgi:hypothetical protein